MNINILRNRLLIILPNSEIWDLGIRFLHLHQPQPSLKGVFAYKAKQRSKAANYGFGPKMSFWSLVLEDWTWLCLTSVMLCLKWKHIPAFYPHSFLWCLELPSLFLYENMGGEREMRKKNHEAVVIKNMVKFFSILSSLILPTNSTF